MRIHVATDHAGLDFSKTVIRHLSDAGHDVTDHGPTSYEPLDDYPSFCIAAARAVVRDQQAGHEALGVVFGGSGNGEQMAANKVDGIRAALAYDPELARLAREHNDARVVSLGARMHSLEEGREIVRIFLGTPFSGEERHQRRIDMMTTYEEDGTLPERP